MASMPEDKEKDDGSPVSPPDNASPSGAGARPWMGPFGDDKPFDYGPRDGAVSTADPFRSLTPEDLHLPDHGIESEYRNGAERQYIDVRDDRPAPAAHPCVPSSSTGAENSAPALPTWKLDLRVIPAISLLFLCSFLDRTNVGNARILGLQRDMALTDSQYEFGLMIFYLTYILSELPSNLIIRRVRPTRWLPLLTVSWGVVVIGLGFARSAPAFILLRALLGLAEGGLLPGIVLYLSSLYHRNQITLRIGIFYSAASLSGAFGGLLARGLAEIGTKRGIEGWRWILIVEGIVTCAVAGFAYLVLPEEGSGCARSNTVRSDKARKETGRPEAGSVSQTGSAATAATETVAPIPRRRTPFVEDNSFRWSEVGRGLRSVSLWLTALAYFAILTGLYSFGLFLPSMVLEMGIAGVDENNGGGTASDPPRSDPNKVQLWTVIPYAAGAIATVVVAYFSDRLKMRGTVILLTLPFAIVGYAVLATAEVTLTPDGPSTSPATRFFMTCLMATGLYSSVPCILAWSSNNSAGYYKRATVTAAQLAVANCGGFLAAYSYPSVDAPGFVPGHTRILLILCVAWVLVLANVLYCSNLNKKKATGLHNRYLGCGDDRDPRFRMVI